MGAPRMAPGVAGGEGALLHHGQQILRERQQPQGIGDGGAGLAHALGHLLLGEAVLLHEGLVAPGLLGGVQVLPLEVLNEADLHDLPVVGLNDDRRNLIQARLLGRPPAALPGDDLVVARGQAAHRHRLDHAVDADGVRQIGQGLRIKALPGLIQSRLHLGDGEGDGPLAGDGELRVPQQSVQAPPQAQFCLSFRHINSFLVCRIRN